MNKINGQDFKAMLINGANNLYNVYPEVDSLNVFPVPDGDTGTNMNLTFTNGIKEISNLNSTNIGEISKSFSRGLLMGARGNSGVILSQIFKGISNDLENLESVDSVGLAKAFSKGKAVAYKAVMRPVEGTILTVIREGSDATLKDVKHSNTILETMNMLVDHATVSLNNTPNLLPVLKEVGVVDSGGYGLLKIIEGMRDYMDNKIIEKVDSHGDIESSNVYIDNHEGQYGYCTEFIIKKDVNKSSFSENDFKAYLETIGDSIVVVEDDDIVKIHVHTLQPGLALEKAVTFGDMINIKIENMQEQALENNNFEAVKKEQEMAIIAVSTGSGIEDMFKELRVDYIISGGQTMNPSTSDFVEVIEKINSKNIIILPNNSNIVLAAKQAADISDKNVVVVESKSILQGMVACINYTPEASFEDNINNMNESLPTIKTGEVTYAIKDTTFSGHDIKKDDYLGINGKDLVKTGADLLEICHELIDSLVDDDSEIATLIFGEDLSSDDREEIISYIEDKYDLEIEEVDGKQPLYALYIGIE